MPIDAGLPPAPVEKIEGGRGSGRRPTFLDVRQQRNRRALSPRAAPWAQAFHLPPSGQIEGGVEPPTVGRHSRRPTAEEVGRAGLPLVGRRPGGRSSLADHHRGCAIRCTVLTLTPCVAAITR